MMILECLWKGDSVSQSYEKNKLGATLLNLSETSRELMLMPILNEHDGESIV